MNAKIMALAGMAAILLAAGGAKADITIETVPVGDPGNVGELSGAGAGASGYGPDRMCGSVGYAYNIGKYEVTVGQYAAFLTAVGGVDTYSLYNAIMSNTSYGSGITRSGNGTAGDPYTYSVTTGFATRPVNYVSWGDAARFANWLHNGQPTGAQGLTTTEDGAYNLNGATSDAQLLAVSRQAGWKWAVTSEDEWYKAAYYNPANGAYFDYPTGRNTAPGRDMNDASGNNANYYTGSGTIPIDSGKYTTLVGEFQKSASPYGTFDQGGNLWEWNESILAGSYRGLRGGSFYSNYNGLLAPHRGYESHYGSASESDFFGFRVSEVPEPVSMAVLAVGGVGVLLRRRGVRG